MDRDQIENEIEQLLSNFTEQFTRAKNYKSIPRIELDLMIATISNLYQELYKLNDLTPSSEKKVAVRVPQMMEEKNDSVENANHLIISESEAVIAVPEIFINDLPKEEETIIHRQEQKEAHVAASVKRESVFQEQTKPQSKPVRSLFDDVPTIGDNYKEKKSLHHKIGKTKTERFSDKLQQQPVVDLKRSIGINEKFAFINELFGGNQQQYTQSVEALNSFSNYEQANSHFEELASNMKWNTSSNTYNELNELVKRRFGV